MPITANHPVGMAYLLGNWATDRRMTAVAGRLGTADLYQACLIFHRRLDCRCQATSRRGCESLSGYGSLVAIVVSPIDSDATR